MNSFNAGSRSRAHRVKAGPEGGEVKVETACPVFTPLPTPLGCIEGMGEKKPTAFKLGARGRSQPPREARRCQVIPGQPGREEEALTGMSG